ncbi:hypothetical protein WH47_05360, partial [Habropoda laboriosa]
PHGSTERSLLDKISMYDPLLKRHKSHPFFKRLVTEDKKWIIFHNIPGQKH